MALTSKPARGDRVVYGGPNDERRGKEGTVNNLGWWPEHVGVRWDDKSMAATAPFPSSLTLIVDEPIVEEDWS